MPQGNVEIVQQLQDAFNDGGMGNAATLAFFAADAVFEEPPEQPSPTVAVGRDEIGRIFGLFDEAWEDHRSDMEECRVIDDERVLVLSIEHFRGRDDIEISQPSAAIFTLHDGKITRMQAFWERATALAAVGLSE
jgi:ketosteroid isomerase-like protein